METKLISLPRDGDSYKVLVSVWNEGEIKFELTVRLTGTEMARATAQELGTEQEMFEKLNKYAINEAKRIYQAEKFTSLHKIAIDFSPFW